MKDVTTPTLSIPNEGAEIVITIPQTQALLLDQGYTYNQAGFSYNQIGVKYGGIYNQNYDVQAIDLSFTDIYTPFVPPPISTSIPLGPGFFMLVTQ